MKSTGKAPMSYGGGTPKLQPGSRMAPPPRPQMARQRQMAMGLRRPMRRM